MQIIYTPTLPPGCCFICRAAQRESYIDTGVTQDFDGTAYICNLCIKEMATHYSYLSHDEYKDMRSSKEELEQINYELIRRVGALEESLRALANAGYRSADDGTVIVSGGYLPKDSEDPEYKSPEREKTVGAGEGEITESVHDSDLGELHSDESDSGFTLDI